jgi:hypothetical protein
MTPTRSSAMTITERPRRPETLPVMSGRISHVPHRATAALKMPKTSEVRTRPRRGTRKSGKRSEAASAPM